MNVCVYAILLSFLYSIACLSNVLVPNLDDEKTLDLPSDGYMTVKVDYQNFAGRISDRAKSGEIFKIKVENNNTKFFKTGDALKFKVNKSEQPIWCRARIKDIEPFYMTIAVLNISTCWKRDMKILIGSQLSFNSPKLEERIFEASKYRETLVLKRESFLNQLNKINGFVFNFNEEQLKIAASFDERINQLKREKRLALDQLIDIKKDKVKLQGTLRRVLNKLDETLDFYTVERQEYLFDRWNMDQDTDAPVTQRPLEKVMR